MKSNILKYLASVALAAATVTVAHATALTLTPVSLPGGAAVVSETITFTGTGVGGVPMGSLYSAVYGTSGAYTFVYQVFNSSRSVSPVDYISQLALTGWTLASAGPVTSVGFVSGLINPTSADLSLGGVLDVGFSSLVPGIPGGTTGGNTSDFLVINSTASTYGNYAAGIIDGGVAGPVAYGPNAPDGGTTALLLGAALSALGLIRRKLA